MRKLIRGLIYQKWFYAFLAVVLWFDCYTDVADVIDRVDQFPDFDPRRAYALTLSESEARAEERAAMAGKSVDDIELPL